MRFTLSVIALLFLPALATAANPSDPPKPNILFILADDLGYGDLGVTFQNAHKAMGKPSFSTPNIDQLAANGMLLRQHYTGAPVCAPARGSLMTGQTQGHCPIRDNEFDKPLPPNLLTLGSMLQKAGYRTVAIGKWGLGGHARSSFPAHPMKRGFDDFFGFMLHGTGHVYYHDAEHPLMDGLTDVGAKYENVYSTDLFTARAKQFITNQTTQHPDQPFFMYLAYTAIHNALHVPGEAYPAGAGKTGGLQWPLAPTPKTRNTYIYPEYAQQPWTDDMKRYATMARRLDDGVGDILQLLKDLHIDQNTLIVFTSDNGPANEGGSDPRLFDSWGPFDGFKRDIFEGGVREPAIASWPGHIPTGVDDKTSITAFWDWMPTLAEFAQLPAPAQTDGISFAPLLLGSKEQKQHPYIYIEYDFTEKNRRGTAKDVASRKGDIRGQQQLVRIGDWIGVRTDIKSANDPLRLYDVIKDPHQDHNLANQQQNAGMLKEMEALLVSARRPESDAKRPYDDAAMPAVEPAHAVTAGKIDAVVFPGAFPYTPDVATLKVQQASNVEGMQLPATRPDGKYVVALHGFFKAPANGVYTFTTHSDGGVHLWIHDAHLVNHEAGTTNDTLQASVRLLAGYHPIRVTYLHDAGESAFEVQCSGPGIALQRIPLSALAAE